MVDYVQDDFDDIPGTQLSNHLPNVDLFGGGWSIRLNNANTTIQTDPDNSPDTMLRIDSQTWMNGGIIQIGQTDGQVAATVQNNDLGDEATAILALRQFIGSGNRQNYYACWIKTEFGQIEILKMVQDTATFLVSETYAPFGVDIEEDIFVRVVGNTIDAALLDNAGVSTSVRVQLGPVTDNDLITGDNMACFSDVAGPTGIFYRFVLCQDPQYFRTATDAGVGIDINTPLLYEALVTDTGSAVDLETVVSVDAFVFEVGTAIDITFLNGDQIRVSDLGVALEVPAVPTVITLVAQPASGNDQHEVFASLGTTDAGAGVDVNNAPPALVPQNEIGVASEAVTDLTISLTVNQPALGSEDVPISVSFPVITDANSDVFELVQTAVYTKLLDGLTGTDTLETSIAIISVADSGAALDASLVAATLNVFDLSDGIEALQVLVSTLASESGGTIEVPTAIAILALADSGVGTDLNTFAINASLGDFGVGADSVDLSFFEVHRVVEAALGSSVVSIQNDTFAVDNGLGGENVLQTALVELNEPAAGADLASVVTNLVRYVADGGLGASTAATVSIQVPVSDSGVVNEIVSIVNQFKVLEAGHGLEAEFVYDDKQKLVNIIFVLRARRILFLFNTSGDTGNETT